MIIPVDSSQTAQFGADGTARVQMGPTLYGVRWEINRMAIVTTSVAGTNCRVYRNYEAPTALLDSTYSGDQNTSDTQVELRFGDKLLFVWEGGTVGAFATATISGKQVGR